MYVFRVPSGIGDISWIYSKLCNFNQDFAIEISSDAPQRSLPLMEILPKVKKSSYGSFSYHQSFVEQDLGVRANQDIRQFPQGTYYLSLNRHLEQGHRIEKYIEELPVDYHYELNIERFKVSALEKIKHLKRPIVTVYCSKYAGYKHPAWKFLGPLEWAWFLQKVHAELDCSFVFIGASFDDELGKESARLVRTFAETAELIGQTHIGEVCWIMKSSKYLFAYPSGMGVLGDVLNVPTMHFIPETIKGIRNSYADPKNIASGFHLNPSMLSKEAAIKLFLEKGMQHCV